MLFYAEKNKDHFNIKQSLFCTKLFVKLRNKEKQKVTHTKKKNRKKNKKRVMTAEDSFFKGLSL